MAASAAPPHGADAAVHTAPDGAVEMVNASVEEIGKPAVAAPATSAQPKPTAPPTKPTPKPAQSPLAAATAQIKQMAADLARGVKQAAHDLPIGAKRFGNDLMVLAHKLHDDPIAGWFVGKVPDPKALQSMAQDAGAASAKKPAWRKIIGLAGAAITQAASVLPEIGKAAKEAKIGKQAIEAAGGLKIAKTIGEKVKALFQNENEEGAHVIAKHVAKTEKQLSNRLKHEPNIDAASSFYNERIAADVAATTLKDYESDVAKWMASNVRKDLDIRVPGKVARALGIVLTRGKRSVEEGQDAIVVLAKDGKGSYFVRTAFPAVPEAK